jgi:hypothetical protein
MMPAWICQMKLPARLDTTEHMQGANEIGARFHVHGIFKTGTGEGLGSGSIARCPENGNFRAASRTQPDPHFPHDRFWSE